MGWQHASWKTWEFGYIKFALPLSSSLGVEKKLSLVRSALLLDPKGLSSLQLMKLVSSTITTSALSTSCSDLSGKAKELEPAYSSHSESISKRFVLKW